MVLVDLILSTNGVCCKVNRATTFGITDTKFMSQF